MPAGHPTHYKPEYCEKVLEFGAQGWHVWEMADALDVCDKTLYNWAQDNPEFLYAFTRARLRTKGWWFRKARENVGNKDYNAKLHEICLKFGLRINEIRSVYIPLMKEQKTFSGKSKIILDALADGEINPDEAKKIAETISLSAKTEDVEHLQRKIHEIEKAMSNQ